MQRSGLDALSLDGLQRLFAIAEAAAAAQRAVIGQQMTDQLPLLVGPVAAREATRGRYERIGRRREKDRKRE